MLVPNFHFYILLHHVRPQEFLATTALFYFIVTKALCAYACANINTTAAAQNTLWWPYQDDRPAKEFRPERLRFGVRAKPCHARADTLWQHRCYALDASHQRVPEFSITGLMRKSHRTAKPWGGCHCYPLALKPAQIPHPPLSPVCETCPVTLSYMTQVSNTGHLLLQFIWWINLNKVGFFGQY